MLEKAGDILTVCDSAYALRRDCRVGVIGGSGNDVELTVEEGLVPYRGALCLRVVRVVGELKCGQATRAAASEERQRRTLRPTAFSKSLITRHQSGLM